MSVAAPALRSPVPWRTVSWLGAIGAAAALCTLRLDLDIASAFSVRTLDSAAETAARMWPPRTDEATLATVGRALLETLSMSAVGTLLGGLTGLLLMPFCCETLFVRGPLVDEENRPFALRTAALVLHHAARLVANVLRTVPYFVWAMLFWFMVGMGVFPGALALAAHTGGVIARNYAQALDHVDPRPSEALRAAGARRVHVFLFGVLPAARSALASLTLYRWEVNIRESAVLGIVGTVGLGFHVKYAFGVFDHRTATTHLLAMVAIVLCVDAFSAVVRRKLL